jgi:hypothetical protein
VTTREILRRLLIERERKGLIIVALCKDGLGHYKERRAFIQGTLKKPYCALEEVCQGHNHIALGN